jgi:Cyclic nucleotide-binding domain/Major Facilitator Superfamily
LGRARQSRLVQVFVAIAKNRDLLRLQFAFFWFQGTEWAVWIAMLVYAYDHGGATEAGIVAVIQLVPAAIAGPPLSVLADREPPARTLRRGYLVQAALLAVVAAVLIGDGPRYLAYAVAALLTAALTTTRPAQTALVPFLARRPEELTASNVLFGWTESTALLAAPAGAGVLLATAGPGWVFAVAAAVMLVAVLLVVPLDRPATNVDEEAEDGLDVVPHPGIVAELRSGVDALRHETTARMLVFVLATMFTALGALDVVTVVIALDVLDLGQGGSGFLNACFGLGGVLAILVTATFVGRPKLVPWVIGAAVAWGGAFLVLGLHASVAAAVGLLVAAGVAYMVFDVAGRTLLQRAAPADIVSRVFGLMEAVGAIGLAAGSGFVPMIVTAVGVEAAVVATGVVLPVALLLCGRALLHVDEHATVPVVEIALLRCVPFLQALPAPELESLARSLVPVDAEAGQVLTAEGDVGDRFYVIAEGEVDTFTNGERLRRLGRGEGFGEIALLQDVPRTATCIAVGQTRLYALERDPFIAAVTGHRRSRSLAGRLVDRRLASTPQPASTA